MNAKKIASLKLIAEAFSFKKMARKDRKHGKEHQASTSSKVQTKSLTPKTMALENTRSEGQLDAASAKQHGVQRKSLAPVFVPNKFMSGFESYSETVRNGPAALRPSRSKINMVMAKEKREALRGMEPKPSNIEGFAATETITCRPSRPSPPSTSTSSSLPSVGKLSSEDLLQPKKQTLFLPKIQNASKKSITRLTLSEKYLPAGAPPSADISPSHFTQENYEAKKLPRTKVGSVSLLSQRQQVQPSLVGKTSVGEVASPTTDKTNQVKFPVPPSAPNPKASLSLNSSACVRHRKIKTKSRSNSLNSNNMK